MPEPPIITAAALSGLLEKPEGWIYQRLHEQGVARPDDMILLTDAVKLIMIMKDGQVPPKKEEITVKFRLGLCTRIAIATACGKRVMKQETLYRNAAIAAADAIRRTDILDSNHPEKPVRGCQVLLRHMCPYAYKALRAVAWAYKTTPSAVMEWAAYLYISNSMKEKR